MCGIAIARYKDLSDILSRQEKRGLDSLGIINLKHKTYDKCVRDGLDEYQLFMKRLKTNTGLCIMHHRKASVGAVNVYNSHPFRGEKYILMQNGTNRKFFDLHKEKYKKDTDSETLLHYLEEHCNSLDEVRQELSKVDGDIGIVIVLEMATSNTLIFSDGARESYITIQSNILKQYTNFEPGKSEGYKNVGSIIFNSEGEILFKEFKEKLNTESFKPVIQTVLPDRYSSYGYPGYWERDDYKVIRKKEEEEKEIELKFEDVFGDYGEIQSDPQEVEVYKINLTAYNAFILYGFDRQSALVLVYNGCHDLNDLYGMTVNEIKSLSGITKFTLADIIDICECYKIDLIDDEAEDIYDREFENITPGISTIEEIESIMSPKKKITFPFHIDTERFLIDKNIDTDEKLKNMFYEDFKGLPGMTDVMLMDIRKTYIAHNVSLKTRKQKIKTKEKGKDEEYFYSEEILNNGTKLYNDMLSFLMRRGKECTMILDSELGMYAYQNMGIPTTKSIKRVIGRKYNKNMRHQMKRAMNALLKFNPNLKVG